MRKLDSPSSVRFRPVSELDFLRYAKNLSWLLDEPLQRTQELLAQIYGYANRHELRSALKVPDEPGPFDSDWGTFDDAGAMKCSVTDSALRSNRVLNLIAQSKGLYGLTGMTSRWWIARDIGLFESPATHREQFRIVKMEMELLEGLETAAPTARSAHEYAVVGTTWTPDQFVLNFTAIGKAVFEAVRYIVERYDWQPVERSYDANTVVAKLEAISRHHPNNPWSGAAIACFVGRLDNEIGDNARLIFDEAQRSIEIFTSLYDGHEKQTPSHRTFAPDADTFYWPAVLYWGGLAALECGHVIEGKRWLNLNKKISGRDDFSARIALQEFKESKLSKFAHSTRI